MYMKQKKKKNPILKVVLVPEPIRRVDLNDLLILLLETLPCQKKKVYFIDIHV